MRNLLNELLEVLDLLSSPPVKQLDYLHEMSIDELGLEFDDIYNLIGHKYDLKNLTEEQLKLLDKLNSELNQMSKEKYLWTKKALMQKQEWINIRNISSRLKKDILSRS